MTELKEPLRVNAWKYNKCNEIYFKLIESVGHHSPRIEKRAKEYAIDCFLEKKEPDFESFKKQFEETIKRGKTPIAEVTKVGNQYFLTKIYKENMYIPSFSKK